MTVPVSKGHKSAGPLPYLGASGVVDYVFDKDILPVSAHCVNLLARSKPIAFLVSDRSRVNNHIHVLRFRNWKMQKRLETYLNSVSLRGYVTGSAQPKLN